MKKFVAFSMIRLLLFIACADLIAFEINADSSPGCEHYILNIHENKESFSSHA